MTTAAPEKDVSASKEDSRERLREVFLVQFLGALHVCELHSDLTDL